MPLIPDMGPNYSQNDGSDVSQRANNFYANNITMNLSYWTEATYDLRMFIGEQGLMTELYGVLPGRPHMYSFNRILRVINTITGFQRRNRKSLLAIPIENGDQKTSDQFTKLLYWADQQESIGNTISDAFEGACVTGLYMLHVYMDYRKDPISGDIKVDSVPYNSFIMDTFTRKSDLSDCNGIMRRSYVTKQEAMSLLPDFSKDISSMEGGRGARDQKFQYMPEVFAFDQLDKLTYDEYYYRAFRKQKLLVDKETGDTFEWKSTDDEKMKLFLQMYPSVTVVENTIPTVRQAILVNNKTLYDEYTEIDDYPFVPVMTYFNPEIPYWNWRVQGIVRTLRDAQYLYNRRRISELDMIESRLTNPLIYHPDMLINPDDVHQTGQGRQIGVKREYPLGEAVQPMNPPDVPQSYIALSELMAKEIQEISGVNEAMLGSATDEKAGILEMLRQGAGVTMLQGVYDKLDRSMKQLGRLMIKMMQNNFTPAKIQRIIAEQPTQEFYNKNFGKYDCAVEEGVNTTTQRQQEFITLVRLHEMGIPIPPKALLNAITVQNKNELIEMIEQQQQQQAQQQQQQAQIQMQELQARAELSHARAMADVAQGNERNSRVAENFAAAEERKHKAVAEDHAGMLDLIRSIKELETIDLSNIEKLIQMSQALKAAEAATTSQVPTTPTPQTQPNPGQNTPQEQPDMQQQPQMMGQ